MTNTPLWGIVVAALGGAAVGVERQRSGHATGSQARFGGVRTFTLLGGVAGMAGWLTTLHMTGLALVLVAGAVSIVVAGYVAASARDVDGTTEAAALVVIGAGLAAGLGWLALASGTVAICTLLLVEKSQLHALVSRIADEELRAAAQFGVMAIVVLPLLPQGPFGPMGGVRPRELWLLVLFFTGLSFAGYLGRRMFGAEKGYPIAGLLGGIISSTNVTFTFARLSRRETVLSRPLALGAVGACTMLFPRVLLATSVLDINVARALLPYLAAPFALGVVALLLWWRTGEGEQSVGMPTNPLQIGPSLQMALLFQVVLFAVTGVRHLFGEGGLLASGAVLGLADVDALTISMTKTAASGIGAEVAARAIAIGILVNCLMKMLLAAVLGTRQFRYVTALALSAMSIALMVLIAVMR